MMYFDVLDKTGGVKKIVKCIEVKSGENKEIQTEMRFAADRTKGETEIRAVVYGGGKLVLKGKIKIDKGVKMVEGFLRQKILLLGEKAEAVAIPELEIESQDVKASHAASIGQVDEEQIFYLMGRGFSRSEAVELIVRAFLNDEQL